jgi:uncharacterized membrane protein YfcA
MLLIAEIILTVFVWRKGWKWLSLIPLGVAFLIGMMLGASGADLSSAFIFDGLAIIALIIMLVKNPKENPKEIV